MTHNLDLGPEAEAAHALALLRAAELTQQFAPPAEPGGAADVALAAGVFLRLDPEGAVSGSLRSTPGRLLALDLAVQRPGRWIGLHVALGEIALAGRLVLGFACRSRAPAATPLRVALRSGTDGGFADRFFRKTLVAHAEPSVHLDAIELAAAADLPADLPAGPVWRELVLFFRPESQSVEIEDLRLFVL
jgi:hypothetical protein